MNGSTDHLCKSYMAISELITIFNEAIFCNVKYEVKRVISTNSVLICDMKSFLGMQIKPKF